MKATLLLCDGGVLEVEGTPEEVEAFVRLHEKRTTTPAAPLVSPYEQPRMVRAEKPPPHRLDVTCKSH